MSLSQHSFHSYSGFEQRTTEDWLFKFSDLSYSALIEADSVTSLNRKVPRLQAFI